MKKIGIIFIQLFILWGLNEAGTLLVTLTHIPLPGNVVGMVLCFFLLMTGVIKVQWIDGTASFLIRHLSFFFIPISVGLMTLGGIFLKKGFVLMFILCVSAVIGICSSGYLSQRLMRKEGERIHDHHHSL
ncbi:CidA/LrgA family protein [Heyndrickxia camelliae]|uniref:Murein hydrolase regulator LrgA n=1 Tax=Heyndrickxia camelliae TaxID=1707093 RepID=A0A2N3LLV6_9BACI|nr:CidA/LrgA family protein [Heyndrickxia camelliae]PKR85596.1 murein hydrolase regulator LrgA [Heyndrickxia camelliae]